MKEFFDDLGENVEYTCECLSICIVILEKPVYNKRRKERAAGCAGLPEKPEKRRDL